MGLGASAGRPRRFEVAGCCQAACFPTHDTEEIHRTAVVSGAVTSQDHDGKDSSGTIEASLTASWSRKSQTALENLPLCPKVGCSFAFLKSFASQGVKHSAAARLAKRVEERSSRLAMRGGSLVASTASSDAEPEMFTMGSICSNIIKPQTRKSRHSTVLRSGTLMSLEYDQIAQIADEVEEDQEMYSFAELAMEEGLKDSEGNPAFAQATHFVSHAWRYDFTSFVEALGNWLEVTGTPQEGTYFWVDAFVVNQHQGQEYPQEWWSTRFMQAVGEIGNTILVLEPWHDPVPFTRAWVIWELYCTSVTGARLHLTMRPQEMKNFNDTLVNSFEKVQTVLSNLDVSKSEAFHKVDQQMIHNEIKRTIGFTKLNELVQTRLLQWLMETARGRLVKMQQEIGLPSRREDPEKVKLLNDSHKLKGNLARMLRESGNVSEAEVCFRELFTELSTSKGASHLETLGCVNQLAVTLQKAGKNDEALTLHRDCLNRRVSLLGAVHADSLQSASNLAVLLSQQTPLSAKAFAEARELFLQAIRGREQTVGPDNVSTLYTVSNLAKHLSEAPPSLASTELLAEAEDLHRRAVQGLTDKLHEAHPLTLAAMHAQAVHWLTRVDMEAPSSPNSSSSTSPEHAGGSMVRQAMEQLRMVHTLRTEKLGRQHPDTTITEQALKACTQRLRRMRASKGVTFTSWAELSLEEYPELRTAAQFSEARVRLRQYGADRLLAELEGRGVVDLETKLLTTGMTPFNIFARIAAGIMVQSNMVEEQPKLGEFQKHFMIVCNRAECDEMWESRDPTWMGKASMSKRHRMLILKDLHWEWFNALTFGIVTDLEAGIAKLKDMREAAHLWVRAQSDWPSIDRVGLFMHIYAHCSVNAFHLHIVDLENVGPTFEKMLYKNLPLEMAISVLEAEAKELKELQET
mmetsp:Transcript_146609/g.372033  ORF Transcript_146609/g.372033 Transcript_146609/m.372033 type:complete len:916 (+) Transcript_146609:162-2909(+)